jgi:sigma-E factor negative regulatory protein RseA
MMNKETRQHVSSLVDGETSRETSRFLVRRLGADEELRATWTRYHLIRDCLRHQDGGVAGEDLSTRVLQALENEGPKEPSRRFATGWLKPAAGFAIAASVALMALVTVVQENPESAQSAGELAGSAAPVQFTSPQSWTPAPTSSQASTGSRKMDSYLLRHYQATGGATGVKGFVAFVPIVINGAQTTGATGEEQQEESTEVSKRDKETQ